jgi:uncharacterized protein YutE (UPF0331/DUF86 family)
VVDSVLVAAKIVTVQDAIARVRDVLPESVDSFIADRTAREVVTLNVFVAIQACLDLAAHWLSDAGRNVPATYAEIFTALADQDVIPRDLARRLGTAAAFRNLVAHQYGVLDWQRVYALAQANLGDLETFCSMLADRTRNQ